MATLINGASIHNGVNLQPSYYQNGNVNFGWDVMRMHPKIKTVRIEIEPGKVIQAKQWTAQAQHNDYTVIATYHKHAANGSNRKVDLVNAAKWWLENYELLGGNFIINLMNEWGNHDVTAAHYANCYNEAIEIIRPVYDKDLIIDLPGWAQATDIACQVFNQFNPLITDNRLILAIHIYNNSWNASANAYLSTQDLDILSAINKRCIVTEFGTGAEGGCEWQHCVTYAKKLGWSVLGWCWNGDGGDMNMVEPGWNTAPSAQTFKTSNYFNKIYNLL